MYSHISYPFPGIPTKRNRLFLAVLSMEKMRRRRDGVPAKRAGSQREDGACMTTGL